MKTEFVTNYIDKKLNENPNYIRYTFYELRVKNNLSEEETDEFLRINRDYFENKGYLLKEKYRPRLDYLTVVDEFLEVKNG